MNRFDTLEAYLHSTWHLLIKAALQRKGNYQLPVIGTQGAAGVQQRVVVLRSVDQQQRRLTFFTDARSAKVAALQASPHLSWLFWDIRKKVQIRITGPCILHRKDDLCRTCWDRLPVQARQSYATSQAPGSAAQSDAQGLPDNWHKDMDLSETEFAFEHFMVVNAQADDIECLHLHPDGHQRAQFKWANDKWEGQWLVP